ATPTRVSDKTRASLCASRPFIDTNDYKQATMTYQRCIYDLSLGAHCFTTSVGRK
ncbi:hypothetical protein J6590_091887, partial [Homalodisca vitripennis]